jgi:hypothetical protein
MDYPGKVITKTQVTPTQTSASGNWTLDDQAAAIKNNNWPVALVPNPISKSLRFNNADSAYLNRTPATASNRRTWTWSGWVKRSVLGGDQKLFQVETSSGVVYTDIKFASDIIYLDSYGGTSALQARAYTNAVFRDVGAWYHVVAVLNTPSATATDRAIIYVNGVRQAVTISDGFDQNAELLINTTSEHRIGADVLGNEGYLGGYLTEVNFIDGQALDPTSFGMTNPQTGQWIPLKYSGTYGTNGFYLNFKDATSTTTLGLDYSGNANNWTANNFSVGGTSSKVLEIVDATKSGSVTLSATVVGSGTVNLTAFGGCGNISGSVFTGIGSLNGLISDWQTHTVYKNGSSLFTVQGGAVNNNSGTQTATQSRTAQTVTQTGISVVSGDVISIAFGANNAVTAYYGYPNGAPSLTITASSGAFIADGSANDSLTDVPTPWFAYNTTGDVGGVIRGNYCTMNPVDRNASYPIGLANGNLQITTAAAGGTYYNGRATISPKTKSYIEFKLDGATNFFAFGLQVDSEAVIGNNYVGSTSGSYSIGELGFSDYRLFNNASSTATGVTKASGDTFQMAFDPDTGKVWFGVNGTWVNSGNPSTGANAAYTLSTSASYLVALTNRDSATGYVNFGQRPFAYTPPTGFRSLCTTNLPATTIGFGLTNQANYYFDVKTWSGNSSTQSIALNFAPDFIWNKSRSAASGHSWWDVLRGTGAQISSNDADAESTGYNAITSFSNDAISLGVDNTGAYNGRTNETGRTYVGWVWNAGDSTVTNTTGSISAQVRASTTSGFSIISYTGNKTSGATIGHGLGVAPAMVIIKERANSSDWIIYHQSLGATQSIYFTTAAANTNSIWFNNTAPSSTVITLGNSDGTNRANTMIAYAFAPVAGYSAFGSYSGNGSSDGPFVYLGFRPEFIMTKSTSGSREWYMYDAARDTYNVATNYLRANTSAAAGSFTSYDMVSNGFKLRSSDTAFNGSGETYIYMAFAEFPFQFANAR